jgi:hypothetical protein
VLRHGEDGGSAEGSSTSSVCAFYFDFFVPEVRACVVRSGFRA